MKDLIKRIGVKLTGHKAMFTVAVLVVICFVDLSATNASVLEKLIYSVLGVKAVQYAKEALQSRRDEGGD